MDGRLLDAPSVEAALTLSKGITRGRGDSLAPSRHPSDDSDEDNRLAPHDRNPGHAGLNDYLLYQRAMFAQSQTISGQAMEIQRLTAEVQRLQLALASAPAPAPAPEAAPEAAPAATEPASESESESESASAPVDWENAERFPNQALTALTVLPFAEQQLVRKMLLEARDIVTRLEWVKFTARNPDNKDEVLEFCGFQPSGSIGGRSEIKTLPQVSKSTACRIKVKVHGSFDYGTDYVTLTLWEKEGNRQITNENCEELGSALGPFNPQGMAGQTSLSEFKGKTLTSRKFRFDENGNMSVNPFFVKFTSEKLTGSTNEDAPKTYFLRIALSTDERVYLDTVPFHIFARKNRYEVERKRLKEEAAAAAAAGPSSPPPGVIEVHAELVTEDPPL